MVIGDSIGIDFSKMQTEVLKSDSIDESLIKKTVDECLTKMFDDLLKNSYFGNPKSPTLPGDTPTQTLFVNVKIMNNNEMKDAPSKAVQTNILTNILGFKPEATAVNADGSYRLKLKNMDMNKLTGKNEITLNGVEYLIKAEPDKNLNQGKGIFYRRDLINEDLADMQNELKRYGVTEVYPFTRKAQKDDGTIEYKRTGTFKITFATNIVPREMSIFMLKTKINLYFDKPMYCSNCGQFAHTQKRCQNTKKCGKDDYVDEKQCQNEMQCVNSVNCLGEHELVPKVCPTYKFEENSTLAQIPVSVAPWKFALKNAAEHAIPKFCGKFNSKKCKSWWNSEIAAARKEQRRLERIVKKQTNSRNTNLAALEIHKSNFRKQRFTLRLLIQESKNNEIFKSVTED